MDSTEYWDRARQISKYLKDYLAKFSGEHKEYLPILPTYTNKNIHLNGVQFVAGYLAKNKNEETWKEYAPIAIAIELVMLWAYKTNRIVDHKQEIWECPEKIKETALEHDLFLALLLDLSEMGKEALDENYEHWNTILHHLLSSMAKGFWIERQQLNVHVTSLEDIIKNWDENYSHRNLSFNLVYDYSPLIGYWLASKDYQIFDKYERQLPLKNRLSYVGQVINDLSDWISVHDKNVKSYQDQFADIRNGIITYPAHELIKEPFLMKAIRNPEVTNSPDWQREASQLIAEKGIPCRINQTGEESYEAHMSFWREVLGEDDEFLDRTYELLRNNKYFAALTVNRVGAESRVLT